MKRMNGLLGLSALFLCLGAEAAYAQKVEVHPYAGGFFSSDWREDFRLKNEGIYGVKVGVFASETLELEGNFGYINHFKFRNTDPRTRAAIWEFSPSWNIFPSTFSRVAPYVTVGVGGVTGIVGKPNDAFVNDPEDAANFSPSNGPGLVMEDGDTFLQVSYGGGFKALNLWGPVGLRADIRGRSMPNFFGNSATWLETTGGLTFTWGER